MFVSYHVTRCKGRCCLLILALQTVTAEIWQLTLLEGSALRKTRLYTVCHRTRWLWGGGEIFQSLVFLACVNVLVSFLQKNYERL